MSSPSECISTKFDSLPNSPFASYHHVCLPFSFFSRHFVKSVDAIHLWLCPVSAIFLLHYYCTCAWVGLPLVRFSVNLIGCYKSVQLAPPIQSSRHPMAWACCMGSCLMLACRSAIALQCHTYTCRLTPRSPKQCVVRCEDVHGTYNWLSPVGRSVRVFDGVFEDYWRYYFGDSHHSYSAVSLQKTRHGTEEG